MFPLIGQERARYAASIGLAECVAVGEVIDFTQAWRVIAGRSYRPIQSGWAVHDASSREAAEHVGRSALHVLWLVLLTDLNPKADIDSSIAMQEALKGLSSAEEAAHAPSKNDTGSDDDRRLARAGFESDRKRVEKMHADLTDWLGEPIESGADGPFGELWPDGRAPTWYASSLSAAPRIAPGDKFSGGPMPSDVDVVCWHLESPTDTSIERIVSEINRHIAARNDSDLPQPAFVVHAPAADSTSAGKLTEAGAIFLGDPNVGDSAPRSSAALAKALASSLRAGGIGWEEVGGLWKYADFRAAWRDAAVSIADPQQGALVIPGASPDPRQSSTALASEKDYEWLVEQSRPLLERMKNEQGWPTDN